MTTGAAPEASRDPLDGIPCHVVTLFKQFAFQVIHQGYERYSADAILHRIRWHMNIERGDREFKCNNNWTAVLSRWFMREYSRPGFFQVRKSQHDGDFN